jgi:aminomethyltransferase
MKQLHLAKVHRELKAQMVEFAGWDMPIQYSGITEEHMAVRNAVGLFDISHMGEISIRGRGALNFLQRVTTNDVSKLAMGDAHYSTVLNENGGTLDDIFVYRLGEQDYMVVVNAVNADKIFKWFKNQAKEEVELNDITMSTVMLALQGPMAQATFQKLTSFDLKTLGRFKAGFIEVAGMKTLVSRSGYTGEDGFELYLMDEPQSEPSRGEKLWNELLNAGKEFGIKPCGLGARDSLRLEAGYVLYGHELAEYITPLEARIGFAVKLDKGDFIGREALLKQKEKGLTRTRIGLRMGDKGVPRQGYKVFADHEEAGYVTSGTLSPLLNIGIAMGYAPPSIKDANEVTIDIHGKQKEAEVVEMPFYDTAKFGFRREQVG